MAPITVTPSAWRTTMPLTGAMNGAGETRPPMLAAFISNWPVKLPLCWVLAVPMGWGADGVWLGMLFSILLEALLIVFWFRRGTWKDREV